VDGTPSVPAGLADGRRPAATEQNVGGVEGLSDVGADEPARRNVGGTPGAPAVLAVDILSAPAALSDAHEPSPRVVAAAWKLACGLILVALIGSIPVIRELVRPPRAGEPPGLSAWVFLCLLASLVQVSYSAYLWQLPDTSSIRVSTIALLTTAAAYAMALGATFFSGSDGWFVQWLQLTDSQMQGPAEAWCLLMLCLTSVLAYLSGRR
jgi:hypothetical protein